MHRNQTQINVSNYSRYKKLGLMWIQNGILFQKQYDVDTGKEINPLFQQVTIDELDNTINTLNASLTSLNELKSDLEHTEEENV